MPVPKGLSPERDEILTLRARILALEEAMRLVSSVIVTVYGPHLGGAIGALREDLDRRLNDADFARSLSEVERAAFMDKARASVGMILETFEDRSAPDASTPVKVAN